VIDPFHTEVLLPWTVQPLIRTCRLVLLRHQNVRTGNELFEMWQHSNTWGTTLTDKPE